MTEIEEQVQTDVFNGQLPIHEALAQLRLRLLDLTSRNRLLNFKHSPGKTLQFVSAQPNAISRKLLDNPNNRIEIVPVPEPERKDWVEVNGKMRRPEARAYAETLGIDTSYQLSEPTGMGNVSKLQTLFYPDDLERHCRKLAREAKSAIEETGANMLFLVLGFLEFPHQPDSDRILLAPVLAIPVLLEKGAIDRETGSYRYHLSHTDEELTENLSLREKLRQTYNFDLPEFTDDADPESYFREISEAIQRKQGWKLRRQATLGLLSFTKMLLVRDIDPAKWPMDNNGESTLIQHEIVRMIFQGVDRDARDVATVTMEHDIDSHPLRTLPLIYDADSSQHSALIDAMSGRNMVIEGPPGTGKSQTITNLIAAAISHGKSILFVSEKLAALEVVKQRLSLAGLAHFCLELHSNKTHKKRILEELEARRDANFGQSQWLETKLRMLEEKRLTLKAYADLLNAVQGNQQEFTVHQILWRAERYRQQCEDDWEAVRQLLWPNAPTQTSAEFERFSEMLNAVARQYHEIESYNTEHPFWGFFPLEYMPGTDLSVLQILQEYYPTFQQMRNSLSEAARFLGGERLRMSRENAQKLMGVLSNIIPADRQSMAHDLLPLLFPDEDPEGEGSRAIIAQFGNNVKSVHDLEGTIDGCLRQPQEISDHDAAEAKTLRTQLLPIGISGKTIRQLQIVKEQLVIKLQNVKQGRIRIAEIGELAGQPFSDTISSLACIKALLDSAAEAPSGDLHYRHDGLNHPEAVAVIQSSREEYDRLLAEHQVLSNLLYLDDVVEQDLHTAIQALREGDAWYRIFQGRWRRACAFHRKLDKGKRKLRGADCLQEMEHLEEHSKANKAWEQHDLFRQVIGSLFRGDKTPFDAAIGIAEWASTMRNRLTKTGLRPECNLMFVDEIKVFELANVKAEFDTAATYLSQLKEYLQQQVSAIALGGQLHNAQTFDELISFGDKFHTIIEDALGKLNNWSESDKAIDKILGAVEAAVKLPFAQQTVENDTEARRLLGEHFRGLSTDFAPIEGALLYGCQVNALRLPQSVRNVLLTEVVKENHGTLSRLIAEVQSGWDSITRFADLLVKIGNFNLEQWANCSSNEFSFHDNLVQRTGIAIENIGKLLPWVQYLQAAKRTRDAGLQDFVVKLENNEIAYNHLVPAFGYRFYSSIAESLFYTIPTLGQFAGATHDQVRADFAKLDKEIIKLRGQDVAQQAARAARPPQGNNGVRVDDLTEMTLLNHLIPQQRPRIAVRKMLKRAGTAIRELKPCFMMGPQAVAQFLEPGQVLFDIVVMDEASQLKPEEAIGAIARGKQLIVVGDPKQLPPTTFFDRHGQDDGDGDGQQAAALNSESILDVCIGRFSPVRTLRWHYRSRHESLIAFSNHHFYKGKLFVFPSPYAKNKLLGLRLCHINGATYENQMNKQEAARVVDAVVDHMRHHQDESLGVVTLNLKQRDLIEELLEQRVRNLPDTETYRTHWESEGMGLFVKNLENVQGDERDVIFISTTFGKAPGTKVVRQNFGPISRQGGWRRLNVLFTRARKAVQVFSSMHPEDIIVDTGTPEGTKALRAYLEYARSGNLEQAVSTGGEYESPFEESVGEMLRQYDYNVVCQVGVAGFRLDLAVKHPLYPSAYMAAIECDGASYHSGVSVRDRDRIRQEILESLGWKDRIWRIWSTDWFRNPKNEMSRLLEFLKNLESIPLDGAYLVEDIEPSQLAAPLAEVELSATNVATQQTLWEWEKDHQHDAEENLDQAEAYVQQEDCDDIEVEVGYTVVFEMLEKAGEEQTVCITHSATDLAQGFLAQTAPLAQVLLGGVVGDEVVLRVPGQQPKNIVIKRIIRPGT